DKPEAPLTVEPITVYRDVAVAGWAQGDGGGRALLRKKHDRWVLTLCSGDALREAKSLQHFGLTAEEAAAMAKAVTEAEAKIDPKLVSKFSTFDGVVTMGGDGAHPPAGAHGKGHSQ
ncbi:copper uptake system-associated protein, partial [Rhizobiaceae sp. 2RAB30]